MQLVYMLIESVLTEVHPSCYLLPAIDEVDPHFIVCLTILIPL